MKVLIILADGFEEIECITTADVLARLGYIISFAGVNDAKSVTGAHGFTLQTNNTLSAINSIEFSAVILPGGMPGSSNLRDDEQVISLVKNFHANGKLVCAICAAPIVLARAGVLENKRVTCYPGFEQQLGNVRHTGELVEHCENIVTAKGPGAAFDFAVVIAESLGTEKSRINELMTAMIVQ